VSAAATADLVKIDHGVGERPRPVPDLPVGRGRLRPPPAYRSEEARTPSRRKT